jgi:hypothetical protein
VGPRVAGASGPLPPRCHRTPRWFAISIGAPRFELGTSGPPDSSALYSGSLSGSMALSSEMSLTEDSRESLTDPRNAKDARQDVPRRKCITAQRSSGTVPPPSDIVRAVTKVTARAYGLR